MTDTLSPVVGDDERMPEGWGAGSWRITGHSEVPGWLLIPADPGNRDEWVAGRADEIRAAWGEHWDDRWHETVPALLRAGLDARPVEAALAFQIWPVPAPLLAQVTVFFGKRPAVLPEELASGGRYVADGLGAGIALARTVDDPVTGATLVGSEISFLGEDTLVVVRFEPTVAELFGMLVGQFHAFVHTLEFLDPEGVPVVASVPGGFPAARSDEDWVEGVGAP